MKSTSLLLALALTGCAASSESPGTASPEETGRVREVIERHNANLTRWYAAGQIDSVASVLAEDAIQMPPDTDPLVGREAIRQQWKLLTGLGRWQIAFDAQEVVVSGRVGVERGRYALAFTPGASAPAGLSPTQTRGNYVAYWRHDPDGEWRMVWHAIVSQAPPAGQSGS